MPETFVVRFGDDWVRMSEDQKPLVESSAQKAGKSWKNLRTMVISTEILLGISDELNLGLPEGITRGEVELGNKVVQDIYIRWARDKGEMDEESERFLRVQMTEEEVRKHIGSGEYERELERIRRAEENGKPLKKLWKE